MNPATRVHDGSHGDDCFGCRIQTIQVAPSVTPTRSPRHGQPRDPHNSWERGILRDERGMAVLQGGKEIGLKQYADNRHQIDRQLKALKQGHDPAMA